MLHRQYGDAAIIARHYDSAKKWVDYMLGFVQDGIIDRDSYGDWCVPPEDPDVHPLARTRPASPTRRCSPRRISTTTCG